jgi:hypothetical protein
MACRPDLDGRDLRSRLEGSIRCLRGYARPGYVWLCPAVVKPLPFGWPRSRVARRPPGSCRFRPGPDEQIRLAVKGLTAKTLEGRAAPDTGEFSQGRRRGAITAGSQEGSRLPAVEPTFKFDIHI